jgi:tripartite-type tricarboxylate transporter receptor subunit TctC
MRLKGMLLTVAASLFVIFMMSDNIECAGPQDTYPNGPVTMIVSWAAGGAADTSARAVAESSKRFLGQPIVVQNMAGAGGAQGAVYVAKAKPDGYTILYTTGSMVTQPHFEDVPYKVLEDYVPVIQVGGYPTMIVVRTDSKFKNFKDVVEFAKKNPGKLNYSTSGFGSIHHLLAELLFQTAGIELTHVPFQDLRQGVNALLGGHLDLAAATPFDVVGHLQEGRVRSLGLFLGERYKGLPEIPTFKEQGYESVGFGWWGVAVPKGTPPRIVQKLHDAFKQGLDNPPFTTVMSNLKTPILYLNSQDFANRWKEDFDKYAKVAKRLSK